MKVGWYICKGHSGDSSSHANPLTFSLTVVSCNRICSQKSFRVTARGVQWKRIHPRQIKGLNGLSRRRDAQAKDKTMLGSTRDFISALGNTQSGRITRIVIRVAATGKHTSHSQNLGYTEQTPRYLVNNHDCAEFSSRKPQRCPCFRAKLDE